MPARSDRPSALHRALLIFAWVLALPVLPGAAAPPVRFAPVAVEDRKITHEHFHGLLDYLAQATGLTFELVYISSHAEIVDRFRNNEIDLAYLGPLPYLILERDFPPAEPVVCFLEADGAPNYTCSLVVYGDSGLDLASLRGVRFGLTQPYSTCGYLGASQILADAGLALDGDGNSFRYVGSHANAALGVVRGEFDVAGVKTEAAERYAHMDLRIVARSRPFPGFTLAANGSTLDAAAIARIREAMTAIDPLTDPADRALVTGWGKSIANGAVSPELCDYSGVADILRNIPWPIPGAPQ